MMLPGLLFDTRLEHFVDKKKDRGNNILYFFYKQSIIWATITDQLTTRRKTKTKANKSQLVVK